MAAPSRNQRVSVLLNGRPIGELVDHSGALELTDLAIPAHALQETNVLTFKLLDASARAGPDANPERMRALRVAWLRMTP
jgi:hypothetical protein